MNGSMSVDWVANALADAARFRTVWAPAVGTEPCVSDMAWM
jgi:hypothetical protein